MKYYLGIDGGGTKTKLIVIDETKKVIYETIGGPSSIDTVSNEETFNVFFNLLNNLNQKLVFTAVFAGLGGIVSKDDELTVEKIIKRLPQVTEKTIITVKNDMYNALYSGLLFEEGMALIAGTGMVAFGIGLDGKKAKCGGWGYKEGDSGSGYSIGRSGYRHLIRVLDGRYQSDGFSKDLSEAINLSNTNQIIETLDNLYNDRTKVASLAPIITKHANLGNHYAIKIVEEETDQLTLAVKGVYQQLKLKNKVLVIVGTLGNVDGLFKNLLHKKIKEIDNNIKIIAPQVDPALAAALAALNEVN